MKPLIVTLLLLISAGLFIAALYPVDGYRTPANVEELGEMLFNDTILSQDYSISCASCHIPQFGFADTTAFSKGVNNKTTTRNSPSVANVLARSLFFWDGRAQTLEEQALLPISNPDEMNLPIAEAVARLNNHPNYKKYFETIFGQAPNRQNLAKAIAAFEKTLETSSTRFDRFMNDEEAFTLSEQRGQEIFNNRAKCFDCHFGTDFTGDEFKNIGLFDGNALNDSGRYKITKLANDIGKFKVPGLRNVAVTAPYMHNGMFSTLQEVIEYYNNPNSFIVAPKNRDTLLATPLQLSEQDKQDLEAFLRTLTDDRFAK